MEAPPTDALLTPDRANMPFGHRWTLIVSCVGVALVVASMAALYAALPDLAATTGATQTQLTWVVDGYTLALACLVLPSGAIGDRYGRRFVLLAGLVVFAIGSAVPLLESAPAWVIGARVVSGIGAALVMPSTLSILTAGFPPEQHGRAIGIWAGVAGSGGAIGLLGSGAVLEVWSWSAIFVALTVAAVVTALAAIFVPESRDQSGPRVDVAGAAASTVAIGVFVYGISDAPEHGWTSVRVLGLLVIAALAAAVFVLVELRSDHPLLPIRLFARRGFSAGVSSLTVQALITLGMFLLLVQYLQLILGYSPLRAAVGLAPMIVPVVGLSLVAPWLCARVGLRAITAVGMCVVSLGTGLMARIDLGTGYSHLLILILIMGTGLGMCGAPATAAIVADTPATKHGVAAAVNDAAREIGSALGIAVCGSVLAAGYRVGVAPALPQLPDAARGPVSDSLAAALAVTDRAGPAAAPLADLARHAFLHGIHHAVAAVSVIAAAGAIAALAAPGRGYRPDPDEHDA